MEPRMSRVRIVKNLCVLSVSFLLLFTAYDGISMLQSTMNGKDGVGTTSQAVIYLCFGLSSIILPKYMIKKLGCKTAILVSMVTYCPYIAANFYPTWSIMMVTGFLLGTGAGVLWAAQGTYFNEAAFMYCNSYEANCKHDSRNDEEHAAYKVSSKNLQNIVSGRTHSTGCHRSESERIAGTEKNNRGVGSNFSKTARKVVGNKNEKSSQGKDKVCISVIDLNHEKLNNAPLSDMRHPTEGKTEKLSNILENRNSYSSPDVKNTEHPENKREQNVDKVKRNSSLESTTSLFFGCFSAIFYSANVWSNLLSHYVLVTDQSANIQENATRLACGAAFCNSETFNDGVKVDDVPENKRYILTSVTLGICFALYFLVFFCLDSLETKKDNVTFSVNYTIATLKHMKHVKQLLLVLLSVSTGVMQGFYTADFTKSYIQCGWNVSRVGLVTVYYGLASGLGALVAGCLVRFTGRVPVMVACQLFNTGLYVFLLIWTPDAHTPMVFYLTAAGLGSVVGIYRSTLPAFIGILFKDEEESAFASFFVCSAMGWTMSFVYSDYLCTSVKIYILLAITNCGMIAYLTAEYQFWKGKKQKVSS